jgi:menaquinone-dependent protoporphyrinogen oxidase
MYVLVAYASRHGATAGIAERVGERLRSAGLTVDVRPVREVRDVKPYDAFVVGGAAYMFHWLKDASAFVKRHRAVLAERPTWLFSSGPIGTDRIDKDGKDVIEASVPKEFPELTAAVRPRGTEIFFGAWDPDAPPVGMAERLFQLMPVSKESLPAGDFRDWPAIEAWADGIAAALGAASPTPVGAARG